MRKPAIAVVVHTVLAGRTADDAQGVTSAAAIARPHQGRRRRALWRLDPSGRHPRLGPRPEPENAELCLALLDEAIARAERWLARRERALADLDARTVEIIRGLRGAGMLGPATTWEIP
jgi:hypothetical protein